MFVNILKTYKYLIRGVVKRDTTTRKALKHIAKHWTYAMKSLGILFYFFLVCPGAAGGRPGAARGPLGAAGGRPGAAGGRRGPPGSRQDAQKPDVAKNCESNMSKYYRFVYFTNAYWFYIDFILIL